MKTSRDNVSPTLKLRSSLLPSGNVDLARPSVRKIAKPQDGRA